MKNTGIVAIFLTVLALGPGCSKAPAEKKEASGKPSGSDPGNVLRKVEMPKVMVQLHYRLPAQSDKLKAALAPLAGPTLPLIWPHLESVKSLSMWVFEPPASTPGTFTPPRFVLCLKGKATDWLYLGSLQTPDDKAISFVKDQMQSIRGPEGSHPVYYLLDRGAWACLGSTEALARDAFGWTAPKGSADGVVLLQGHVPSLFSMSAQKDFATAVDSLMALSGVTALQMAKVRELFASLEEVQLTFDLNQGLEWLTRLDLVWKESPGFFHAAQKSRIPFSERTLIDLHLEFREGKWMGVELWPLFQNEAGPDSRDKVQAFLGRLKAIDLQLVRQDEGRMAGRIVIDAPGQETFLLEAMEKLVAKLPEKDKYGVRSVEKTADAAIWEAVPTAAEDADVRGVVNTFFGGTMRIESRRSSDAVTWTFGQWPEAAPIATTDDNQRAVWAMLPFFNLVLPYVEEQKQAPPPRYTPYPSVPQDPWRVSARFDAPKKALVLEGSFPLGAWLLSAKEHPEILKRMETLKKAPAPTAPASDL